MSCIPRSFKSMAATMAATVCLVSFGPLGTLSAQAGDHRYWNLHERGYQVYRQAPADQRVYRRAVPRNYVKRPVRRHHHVDNGDIVAAAVLGIIGGALIAGALSQSQPQTVVVPQPPAPNPNSFPARPAQPQAARASGYSGMYQPWTAEWHSWCNTQYRSFNPQTGTYRGYDGVDHFCVPR